MFGDFLSDHNPTIEELLQAELKAMKDRVDTYNTRMYGRRVPPGARIPYEPQQPRETVQSQSAPRGDKDPHDPLGHMAALGLHPTRAFEGLNEQQIQMVIEGTYRIRAKIYHPDTGGDGERFKRIQSAYDALKDPNKRKSSIR